MNSTPLFSSVEYDTGRYHAELQDGEELVECPSCGQEVRLDEMVEIWEPGNGLTEECANCAREEDQ